MAGESTFEVQPMLIAKSQPNFVETPYVRDLVKRALAYVGAGFPIHLVGPAGTGKTSLALYIAAQIGRPVVLMHGDEELGTSDLIGGELGYRRKKVVDNFIHSVLKTQEDVAMGWMDKRLTVACRHGFTLVYDEFTRSRPEANNILLSVLEEKLLDLFGTPEGSYLPVHADFSAIFTSNPEEYAGVHGLQDALRDRMIAMRLHHYDRETEIAITEVKAGVVREEAERIVDIVRAYRQRTRNGSRPTVRASIMIGKVLKQTGARPCVGDNTFAQACVDVLDSESRLDSRTGAEGTADEILGLISKYAGRA